MHTLTRNVIYATGLKREIARQAIMQALVFLRDEAPERHAAEAIEKLRKTAEAQGAAAVSAADRTSTAQVEGADEPSRSKAGALAGALASLGLDEAQSIRLVEEIVAHAEGAPEATDAPGWRRILDDLAEVFERIRPPEESR